jgi:hypothetical protein
VEYVFWMPCMKTNMYRSSSSFLHLVSQFPIQECIIKATTTVHSTHVSDTLICKSCHVINLSVIVINFITIFIPCISINNDSATSILLPSFQYFLHFWTSQHICCGSTSNVSEGFTHQSSDKHHHVINLSYSIHGIQKVSCDDTT